MSQYIVDDTRKIVQRRSSHDVLIIPPLIIITAFCFGFVLMQPQKVVGHTPAASKQTSPGVAGTQTALPPMNFAKNDALPSLTTKPSAAASSDDATTTGTATAPINSSASLQSAASNSGNSIITVAPPKDDSATAEKDSKSKPVTELKNELKSVTNKLKIR